MRTCIQRTRCRIWPTGWKAFIVGGIGIAMLILFSSCVPLFDPFYASLQEQAPPAWSGAHVTVDLSHYLHQHVYQIEFAAQNEPYLGLWSLDPNTTDEMYSYIFSRQVITDVPGAYMVIDFHGNIVEEAVSATGALQEPYVALFPTLAARQRYAEFIRGAKNFWAFSPDWAYGMKSDTCYRDEKGTQTISCWNFELESLNVEFWDLTRNELLWERILIGSTIHFAQLLSWQGQAAILIALPHDAYIVSQETGETLGSFQYEIPQESDPAYTEIFAYFSGFHIAYNATKRWLACGDFESQRVRIFAVDPPYQLIRELNADRQPYGPWTVRGVRFNGNGRYLIIDHEYAGKYTVVVRYPTEVYDVETWERCWYENQYEVQHVTISPDGKKIAFLRGTMLEMGDFYPEKTE